MANKPASFIVVRQGMDGERFAGRFINFGEAEKHAQEHARSAPGSEISVYERKVIYTARIVVDDDRPKDARP